MDRRFTAAFFCVFGGVSALRVSHHPTEGKGGRLKAAAPYVPAQGTGGTLKAAVGSYACPSDGYTPSALEQLFRKQNAEFFNDEKQVCSALGKYTEEWIEQNQGESSVDGDIFSKICRKGEVEQYVEPLAGILRDPRFPCLNESKRLIYSIDWLVMADDRSLKGGKNIFFDAGCTHFSDALAFFVTQYQQRGITFDEVYAWEYVAQPYEDYWAGVSSEMRAFWEPRVHFNNGIGVTTEKGAEHNVVEKIHRLCGPEDFCAFKLDIDTPEIEMGLVHQLLDNPGRTRASLNEFFFEHHVRGIMEMHGWGWMMRKTNETFVDSYNMFTRFRKLGVRAHSWI